MRRATGLELRRVRPTRDERATVIDDPSRAGWPVVPERAPRPGDRLVTAPTFVLCSVRSGSTLLRVLLNSHSQIHAPHELHLRFVTAGITAKWGAKAMA